MHISHPDIRDRAAILNELEYHGLAHLHENAGRLLDKSGNDHSALLCATEEETRARIQELRRPLIAVLRKESPAGDR